jgi:hypothetical protein
VPRRLARIWEVHGEQASLVPFDRSAGMTRANASRAPPSAVGLLTTRVGAAGARVGHETQRAAALHRSPLGIEALAWLTDVAGLSREDLVAPMRWPAQAILHAALTWAPPARGRTDRAELAFLVRWAADLSELRQSDKEVTGGSLLIAGATLIDGSGAQPVWDAAVLTSGERIRYAGPSDGLPDARVDRVLDASGKFVVPGLIDLHTHSTFDADMQTYLKNGVTSIRFAGVSQAAVVAVRERTQRGEVTGPRIFSCGPMLDKSAPAYPQWTSTVNTPSEADRTARRLLSHDRVEALLVAQQITRDLLEPVVLAAHEFGRPVVGQVWATDGAQAARIGIDQLDNTSRIFASREYPTQRLLAYRTVAERLALLGRGWAAVDWDLTRTIIDAMVEHNVVHCPTLVVTQAQAQTITAELKSDWDYQTEFGAAEYQTWATFSGLHREHVDASGPRLPFAVDRDAARVDAMVPSVGWSPGQRNRHAIWWDHAAPRVAQPAGSWSVGDGGDRRGNQRRGHRTTYE